MKKNLQEDHKSLINSIIEDKQKGVSDVEIGAKYNISYRQLEKIITKATGVSISSFKGIKKIKSLAPKDFKEETTTEAINLAKKNIEFNLNDMFEQVYELELLVGDARNLSFLSDNSIDLICSHPPYVNIIHYTNKKEGDLSFFNIDEFLREMEEVARESYRVLKPGRQCAILIGDIRKHKHVIPLGFKFYLDAGFKLKELVIKRQHNCKTTGFWYSNSIKYNFLLLAHEYLPIFKKPFMEERLINEKTMEYGSIQPKFTRVSLKRKPVEFETTTVWLFPEDNIEILLNKNVIKRYASQGRYKVIDICSDSAQTYSLSRRVNKNLLFIKSSILEEEEKSPLNIKLYLDTLQEILKNEVYYIAKGGYFVIQTRDVRFGDYIEPLAKYIVDSIKFSDFVLKEIVVVTTEKQRDTISEGELKIVHKYLLIYEKKK